MNATLIQLGLGVGAAAKAAGTAVAKISVKVSVKTAGIVKNSLNIAKNTATKINKGADDVVEAAGEATDAGVRVGDSFVPSGSSVVKGGTVQLSKNVVTRSGEVIPAGSVVTETGGAIKVVTPNGLTITGRTDNLLGTNQLALPATNNVVLPTPRQVGNLQGGPLENASQISWRFQTNGGPTNGAVYRADNQGNVTSYATYDSYGSITSRVDVDPNSAPHFDKATGQTISAPHVVEYPQNTLPDGSVRTQTNAGVIRTATPDDIP